MTQPTAPSLERDSLVQLLARVGSLAETVAPPPHTPYDWRQSHYFTSVQLERLQEALGPVAEAAAQGLKRVCGASFEISVREVTQHYAAGLMAEYGQAEPPSLFQAFGPAPEEVAGVIALAPEVARTWVGWLMGAGEDEGDSPLGAFEQSLLGDLVGTAVQAWSELGPAFDFPVRSETLGEGLTVPWDRAGHLCRITWTVSKQEGGEEETAQTSQAAWILPCETLASLAGKVTTVQAAAPEAVSAAMIEHLQDHPVAVRVEVGRTSLRFGAVMQLQVHDVVVLDRSVREPIEVWVAGRPAFRAQPGRVQGQQVVRITGPCAPADSGSEL